MKLVILAMLVGSAFANTAFDDIQSMAPLNCPKQLSMVMASMLTGEKLRVDIKTDGTGATWIEVSSHNNDVTFHPITSQMNTADCSTVFNYDVDGHGPEKLVVVKAYMFYEVAPSSWIDGGKTGKVGIAILGQSAPGVFKDFPSDEWLSLNKHKEINKINTPFVNNALKNLDCSHIGNKHLVVADLANSLLGGVFYDVYIKDKTMTVMSKLPVHGADAWEFRTEFDTKTCSAMMPAPIVQHDGSSTFAMRKITASVGTYLDMHQAKWAAKTGIKLGWSFTLTDPSGRMSPINVPIKAAHYPLNRWTVTHMNPIKAGLAATKEDKPAVLV